MKKILILLLFINNLYSTSDLNQTSLDMFLFKIGFKSLLGEFEKQKNMTNQNSEDIEYIKKQVKNMQDINSKRIIQSSINLNNIRNDNKEQKFIQLEQKISNLQKKLNEILKLKLQKNIAAKNTKYKNAILNVPNAQFFKKANSSSEVLFTKQKDSILKIQYCNEFGWCKLYNENAYIAKYKLKF